jgi:hypothetical protein
MSEITSCHLCNDNPFIANNTPVWLITENATQTKEIYQSYNYIKPEKLEQKEINTSLVFTPKARYTLSQYQMIELMTHFKIWNEIIVTPNRVNHGIIFTDQNLNIENIDISHRLENLILPKDWDIIIINNDNRPLEYVVTKRAANILLASCRQFHNPLRIYIKSIPGLRIIDL